MMRKSVTLVELLMVICISIAIFATVLLSVTAIDKKKIDAVARNIVTDLIVARQLAAGQHDNYIVEFSVAGDQYNVYRGSIASSNMILERKINVDLVSVTDWSGISQTGIQFASHTGTAADRLINITFAGQSKSINVTGATGFIKIQ